MYKDEIKSILTKTTTIDIEDLEISTNGNLEVIHSLNGKDVKINSCILKSGTTRLFVFLSAVGIPRENVIFHRLYWSSVFTGICLYIDDPCRHEMNWSPTYYFGSKDDDYTIRIFHLIKKIQILHNIKNENVCFISSSNGGFASIRLSFMLPGSYCIALNPILSIPMHVNIKEKFSNLFCLDLADMLILDRVDLVKSNVLQNSKSKLYIYSNICSNLDKVQIRYFLNSIGISLDETKARIYAINNGAIVLNTVKISDANPHLTQPGMHFCKIIYDLMKSNAPLPVFASVISSLSLMLHEETQIKRKLSESLQ